MTTPEKNEGSKKAFVNHTRIQAEEILQRYQRIGAIETNRV